MNDDFFESRLDHMFAVVDEPVDAMAFREALADRMSRRLLVRRCALFGAGLLGAGVAALAAVPVLPQLMAAAGNAAHGMDGLYGKLAPSAGGALAAAGINPALGGWTVLSLGVLVLAGLVGGLDRLSRI
jgi:hypothetical protein